MQKLTNKEEEIMHILWKLKKAFVKDIMEEIVEEKPHYNTLSTIVRNNDSNFKKREVIQRANNQTITRHFTRCLMSYQPLFYFIPFLGRGCRVNVTAEIASL